MAGGKFDIQVGKIRPGTYINFESRKKQLKGSGERGIVLLPLFKAGWGEHGSMIAILDSAPDGHMDKLGKSIYDIDPNMVLIREALKNATKVIVYIINKGQAATASVGGLTITAKYPGSQGNKINVVIKANPLGGHDVTVYFGAIQAGEYTGIASAEELAGIDNQYVSFASKDSGELSPTAGEALTGGTDGVLTNSDITTFLDASEGIKWTTMCFPVDDTTLEAEGAAAALKTALKSKISYLRDQAGKYVKAVTADFAADYEGIINVTNSVALNTGEKLTKAQATAWVAGIDAGASNTASNTYRAYPEAVSIIGAKTNEEAIEAIKKGEFFFSNAENDSGVEQVCVEYDINSLVSFTEKKTKDYRKNRVMRVFDTFGNALKVNFPPNKYENSPEGWGVMEGQGKLLLEQFQGVGAIKNVDLENDFKVDQVKSEGDETYFQIGLEATDSAEKLYFTVGTR